MADSFTSPRRFTDNKNYPRGLSRHGDYTIKEAQLLEKYGNALLELESGSRKPETTEEKQFVAVCEGKQAAVTDIEKVWMKYIQKTRQPKRFHTLSGGKPQVELNDEYIDD
ncbi:DUF413 domain-containing protein [Thorsellia kenyensis]|uniref:Macrodomain Ori protein n=1 Tax=Thorsellia kenyensis TaxID=1549888 RepID=A0ABV6C8I0_9GAMM